jgi:hypothetical protein
MLLKDASGFYVKPTRIGTAAQFQEPAPGVGMPRQAEEERQTMRLSDIAKDKRANRAMDAIKARYGTPAMLL